MAAPYPRRGVQWEQRHAAAGAPPALTGDLATLAQQVGYVSGQANWLERIETYSPWNDVFRIEQQETELVVDVPWENRYLFLVYCVGYNYVDGNRLRRVNPVQHPYWTWMRCSQVAYKGLSPNGTKTYLGVGAGVANYKLARFSLGFAAYPWRFYEDSQINSSLGQEIFRNVYYEFQPTTQFLSAEGGAATLWKPYADDGTIAPSAQGFKASMGTPCSQILYKLHWKWVPFDYVFKDFVPTNIYNLMGSVNVNDFYAGSMPQGTVRFDQPEIKTYCSPIRAGQFPEILCDITFNLAYFNPTRKFIGTSETPVDPNQVQVSGNAPAIRGHNLVPRRQDNLWEPATRKPTPGVGPAPAPTLYNQMFAYKDIIQAFIKAS